MSQPLSQDQLKALQRISTPTIANAIEVFDIQPRNTGFMSPEVRCLFPELGVMVGYAVTARIRTYKPPEPGKEASRFEFWNSVTSVPSPRVVVIEDLDDPPAIGSFWGEVNASVHKALDCIGTVTNGGVRDLDEVRGMGFHYFAAQVVVSHSYVHLVDFGGPVKVGGLVVRQGDLIHADKHGALVIPSAIAGDIAGASARVEAAERLVIDYCKSKKDFSTEKLKDFWQQMKAAMTAAR